MGGSASVDPAPAAPRAAPRSVKVLIGPWHSCVSVASSVARWRRCATSAAVTVGIPDPRSAREAVPPGGDRPGGAAAAAAAARADRSRGSKRARI
eukprot:8735599-Pyramimonas_sp.AAC.1